MVEKANKNYFIELLRFVFCIVIFLHHSGFLVPVGTDFPFSRTGLYAVEFFFILTGALAMRHFDGRDDIDMPMKQAMSYTIGKLRRVFPYAALGIVLAYAWYFISSFNEVGFKDLVFGRWNILLELLLLPMTGVMSTSMDYYLNTPLWFLSVLLICLPLVVYLAIKCRDFFTYYLSWLLPLMIHGFLINVYGGVGVWGEYTGFVYAGVLRGLSDLMLGCFVYTLSKWIASCEKCPVFLVSIVEVLSYIFCIWVFKANLGGYTCEFAVLLLAFAIGISISGRSLTARSTSAFSHLGALSLPIYCLHWPVYRFLTYFAPGIERVKGLMIALVASIILSELVNAVIRITTRER